MAPHKHYKNEKRNSVHKEFHRDLLESLFPHRFTTQVGTCRQSMSFLDSSIFETSHAEKLVQYIRQKRGINNAQRIFNNSPVDEVVDRSFPIEIEPTQQKDKLISPLKHSAKEDNHLPTCSNSRIPRISSRRISAQKESIGRRILLKEFEKTAGSGKTFHPAASSTPNSVLTNGDPNISGISRITAICHQEEEIPETQESNFNKIAINVDNYFQPITNNNDKQVISDTGIHYSIVVPPNVSQHEDTLKNHSQTNLDDKAHETNDNVTLINKKDGAKEELSFKVLVERNASDHRVNEVLKSPNAHYWLHTSRNRVNSPKSKNPSHSLTVKSLDCSAPSPRMLSKEDKRPAVVQRDTLERPSDSDSDSEPVDYSKNLKENKNPKNKYTGNKSIRNSGRSKSPNRFSNSSPRIEQAVSESPYSSLNPGIKLKDDCNKKNKNSKRESIGQISSNIEHFSRRSRLRDSVRIPSTEQIEQNIALGGTSNSDSGSEDDDENAAPQEDCYNFKENKNSKKKSTDRKISSNINLDSRKIKVKSPNGISRSVKDIASDWNSNFEENHKDSKKNHNTDRSRGRTSSRIDPSSRRSKAKPRNRLLRKVSSSSNKEREVDQQIALEDSSDFDSDSKEDFKEKKIPEKSTGHTSSRFKENPKKSSVGSKAGCPEERVTKKSDFRKEDNDTLKRINKQLNGKLLVYIPIIQNCHKKTESESGKPNNEKIATNDCETITNKVSITKEAVCQNEIEIITSDEEEGEHITTHQVLPRGKTKSQNVLRQNNNSNNPIDLRIRRSNQERKSTLGRLRERKNENKRSGIYQLGSKELVHPTDQLIDEIMLPLEKGPPQQRSPATDCDIYTEEEEVTNNNASLQYSIKTVQEERIDTSRMNSCGVETGALQCSLESLSANTVENFNDKVIDVKSMQNSEINDLRINLDWKNAMNKVSNKLNQQNIPVVHKGKKRLSQMDKMDPVKKNYLDISNKLMKNSLDKINFSRRKLYSKGDSDNDISQLPDISAKISQETPVIAHSKEETRKTLNFSKNSHNVKISNNNKERLESLDITTSTAEPVNKNDDVFKKPAKPASKPTKRKTLKKKHQKNSSTESSNNVTRESNPVISAEENHQCGLISRFNAIETYTLKESTYNECNSADLPVEPDEIDDHHTETVASSRTSVDENSNNRVNNGIEERRQKKLSDIAENTTSRENSIVMTTDQKKVNNNAKNSKKTKKENESHSIFVNAKSKPMASTHPTADADSRKMYISDESNDRLRRSSRQRKSPIVYWSCRLQLYGPGDEEMKKSIPAQKNKKKKNKVLPSVKESKAENKNSSKAKSANTHSKKKSKDDKNKESLENEYFETLQNIVPQNNMSKDTEDKIAMNEGRIAYELFDQLKESFSTEKSKKKRKNPKTCEETTMNKIKKLSEKSPTKYPESSENPSKVVNQQEIAPISSDDGISTSEENHHTKPPWCMASLHTPTTDSGIQTGITSDTHVSKEGRLFSWLKSLSTPRTLTSNKDIVQILHSNTIKIANVEDLMFQEIDGVEYAYYLGEENNYGYMKFHPQSVKPHARAKTVELKFLSLVGSLQMQIDKTSYTIKNGDLVTVPKGVRYGIANTTNDPAILFFIRTA